MRLRWESGHLEPRGFPEGNKAIEGTDKDGWGQGWTGVGVDGVRDGQGQGRVRDMDGRGQGRVRDMDGQGHRWMGAGHGMGAGMDRVRDGRGHGWTGSGMDEDKDGQGQGWAGSGMDRVTDG